MLSTGQQQTICGILVARAREMALREVFLQVNRGRGRTGSLTFQTLLGNASRVAKRLSSTRAGARIVICADPGLDFCVAFFGCLLASRVAVPAVLPRRGKHMRLESIVQDCGAEILIVSENSADRYREICAVSSTVAAVPLMLVSAQTETIEVETLPSSLAKPDALAVIQYTSGSTGATKGVMVTHANLVSNSAAIARRWGHNTDSRGVTWLPPYHDMGLVGGVIQPVFAGGLSALIPPEDFVWDPLLWLKTISELGATTSGGPNFGFDLCSRRVKDSDFASLDLSSWKVASVGAERVDPDSMSRFAATFRRAGFNASAIQPCYGLAEATLFVSSRQPGSGVEVKPFRSEGASLPSVHVSCGKPPPDITLHIVDPVSKRPVLAGGVGEIWLRGDGVARGYWENEQATEETFRARMSDGDVEYLRTGDLGRVVDGELYVVGRRKAVIIVKGVNYQSEDIESVISGSDARFAGASSAVFQVEAIGSSREQLVVVQEVATLHLVRSVREELRLVIFTALASSFSLSPDVVLLVTRGRLPRTESGKIKRWAARAEYEAGSLQDAD